MPYDVDANDFSAQQKHAAVCTIDNNYIVKESSTDFSVG